LLSAREAPNRFDCSLPDLRSRLNALPAVRIGAPDDALLKTVMLKHFADRQLSIDPKVLDFLALRIERSLAAAAVAVAAIDRAALGSGRKLSRQLVAEVLGTEVSSD
jgi:chromosomal replication initiation ATPase DnaA